jgi:hypothetical protein
MDLSLLATLKDKLVHGKVFADVQNYFFDHFGMDPEFMAVGEPFVDAFLEQICKAVGEQMHGRSIEVSHMMLKRIPEHQFVHGTCLLGGKLSTLLYFEDLHQGLMAVTWTIAPPETKFARFRGQPLTGRLPPKPSEN